MSTNNQNDEFTFERDCIYGLRIPNGIVNLYYINNIRYFYERFQLCPRKRSQCTNVGKYAKNNKTQWTFCSSKNFSLCSNIGLKFIWFWLRFDSHQYRDFVVFSLSLQLHRIHKHQKIENNGKHKVSSSILFDLTKLYFWNWPHRHYSKAKHSTAKQSKAQLSTALCIKDTQRKKSHQNSIE